MTLTVRLDGTLESTLTRYCAQRGVSKSLVVQESLAVYLLSAATDTGKPISGQPRAASAFSANFRSFAAAGLVGAGALGGTLGGKSADKAAVRARAQQRLRKTAT